MLALEILTSKTSSGNQGRMEVLETIEELFTHLKDDRHLRKWGWKAELTPLLQQKVIHGRAERCKAGGTSGITAGSGQKPNQLL